MLDEAGRIGTAYLSATPVLERCERTDPARKLHPCTPGGREYVHPSNPWPASNEQPPEDHEENESEMEYNYSVGENAKSHHR